MTKTNGISPKATAAIIAAIVSYLLAQTVLELPPGIVLALNVAAVAIAAVVAGPGDVVTLTPDDPAAPGNVNVAAGDVRPPGR